MDPVVLLGVVVVLGAIAYFVTSSKPGPKEKAQPQSDPPARAKPKPKPAPAKTKKIATQPTTIKQPAHPLFKCSLKGHTGTITGILFPPDGKHLCSTSEDRSVRFWPIKDFNTTPTFIRFNIELDHAVNCSFSPDVKACVVATGQEFRLQLYKLDVKKRVFEFKHFIPNEGTYDQHMVGCGISVAHPTLRTGCTYVMGCTHGKQLDFRTIGGDVLKTFDTKAMYNTCAKTSPNGRFVVVCTYLPTVPLYEIYAKANAFSSVERVSDLGEHNAEVEHAGFSTDSNAVCTISKDGTWVAWDIDVEFNRNSSAKLLGKGEYQRDENAKSVVCISPDKGVVAVGSGRNLFLFSTKEGKLEETVLAAHSKGTINGVEFDPSGAYVVTSGGFDKKMCVWHNVVGHRQRLKHLQDQYKNTTSDGAKDRLKDMILELKKTIKSCS